MALSTRAKLAGLGGALALGVLGATGVAYAGEDPGTPRYVTTVEEGTAGYGQQAPADGERPAGGKDCPEGAAGGTGSPAPQGSAPADPADA